MPPHRHLSLAGRGSGVIALFEFEAGENGVTIASEKHHKLIAPKEVTDLDLETYRGRLDASA